MLVTLPQKKEKEEGNNSPTVMPGDASVPTNPTTDSSLLSFVLTPPASFYFHTLLPALPSFPSAHPSNSLQEKNTQKNIYIHQSNSLTHSSAFKQPQPSLLSHLITITSGSNSTRTLVSYISHHTFTTVNRLCHGR
jgi:hypothetical protein